MRIRRKQEETRAVLEERREPLGGVDVRPERACCGRVCTEVLGPPSLRWWDVPSTAWLTPRTQRREIDDTWIPSLTDLELELQPPSCTGKAMETHFIMIFASGLGRCLTCLI